MTAKRIGISWPLSDSNGWGVFGTNLAVEILRRDGPKPLLLSPPSFTQCPQALVDVLAPLATEQQALIAQIKDAGRQATLNDVVVLHALGNMFVPGEISRMVIGEKNVGFIFFEDTGFDEDALDRARQFDRILVGSSWNQRVLTGLGLEDVVCVLQGIDERLFHPGIATGRFGGRFVIFSGGKLEFRKAQDIVLAAFRIFHARHPEAQLVTAWHNPWPDSAASLEASPHTKSAPGFDENGELLVAEWVREFGIPDDAVVNVGQISNFQMPSLLREAHVGLFPNRCEGGTNLVAMEAMACGVPCILSANTGHLDLIEDGICYPLADQSPCTCENDATGAWCESSVDEIVENLEKIFAARSKAALCGRLGADFMKTLTWRKQTAKLIDAISDMT